MKTVTPLPRFAEWFRKTAPVVDQLLLSTTNFAVGYLALRTLSLEGFAAFNLFLGAYFLVGTVQNALINTPLAVFSLRLPLSARASLDRVLLRRLSVMIAPLCVLGSIATLLFIRTADNWTDVALASVALIALSYRDYFRAREFAALQSVDALRRDFSFAIFAAIATAILLWTESATVGLLLLTVGLPAAMVSLAPLFKTVSRRDAPLAQDISRLVDASGGWSLAGALSSWVQTFSYLYLPALLLGTKEVAGLAAARLLVSPVSLLIQSWGNVARPAIARHLAMGDVAGARSLVRRMTASLVLCAVGLGAIVTLAIRVAPAGLIPARYLYIEPYLWLWLAVTALQVIRSNSAAFLQAALDFRYLAIAGGLAATITVVCGTVLLRVLGGAGALVALALGEVVLIAAFIGREPDYACSTLS